MRTELCIDTESPTRPMRPTTRTKATKKPTNVSINSELLKHARDLKINLSALLESALKDYLRRHQADLWREENREAIARYNDYVEENGVFSDGRRRF